MKELSSKVKSIATLEELASVLDLDSEVLIAISDTADSYYRPNKPTIKDDGTERQTYRVLKTLKDIHEKIKNAIFYSVEYPSYLQGGIRDVKNPRDYIRNATIHSRNKVVIKEDIANFFPSMKYSHVLDIWKNFFRFSDSVSKILARLTTYRGLVPQGAKTSCYLANLVFWEEEPGVEAVLDSMELTYSRLVDDITISTHKRLTNQEKQEITRVVYRMMFKKRFKPKRRKRMFMTSSSQVSIHNLNINSGRPTLNKTERSRIRSAVKECESAATLRIPIEEYEKMFSKARGRVALLERLHPNQAKRYIERLDMVKPSKVYEDVE